MRALSRRTVGVGVAGAIAVITMSTSLFASSGTATTTPRTASGRAASQPVSRDSRDSRDSSWPYAATTRDPVLAAVGDIACEPDNKVNSSNPDSLKCSGQDVGGLRAEYATASQVEHMRPDLVALLGDEQYQVGKLSDFEGSFDKTYGAFKFLQRPAPGNHEYYAYTKHGDNEAAQNGAGYFAYYNGTTADGAIRPQGQAGNYNKGWYSYNLGAWHIISLNAECDSDAFHHKCNPNQDVLRLETQWLTHDLNTNKARCTLAYWHQPTFSASGGNGDRKYANFASNEGGAADTWWKLLYRHHADLVLNGHEHVYARFSPMDPNGNVDAKRGIRQIIIGTGGEDLDTLSSAADLKKEHVVTGEDTAYGVMKLRLGAAGYQFDFRPVAAGTNQPSNVLNYTDAGSARCH